MAGEERQRFEPPQSLEPLLDCPRCKNMLVLSKIDRTPPEEACMQMQYLCLRCNWQQHIRTGTEFSRMPLDVIYRHQTVVACYNNV